MLVCLVTLWSFLFNTFSYDLAWAAGNTIEPTAVGSNRAGGPGLSSFAKASEDKIKEFHVDTFSLPEYLGHIKDSWSSTSTFRRGKLSNEGLAQGEYESLPPVVIHIQDAHCNYAAQRKIAEIIEYLNKQYGIDAINLEGGARDYDLSVFTDIPDKSIRNKASDRFVKEGLVNGAEYFAINNPDKATLWGIEDTNLYLDNLKVYRDSLKHKDEVDRHLKALTYILSNLKTRIYSRELLGLDGKYSQYKSEAITFKDYLAYIIQSAKEKAIDIRSFSNIYLLNQALEEEPGIDFKSANRQRDELIERLQKKLSKKDLEELALKTVEFRVEKISQKDFYAYILGRAKQKDVGLNDLPELRKYIRYVSIYDAIDKTKTMDELEKLEDSIKEEMSKSDKQRELNKLSKNLAILKNLFGITLTKDDHRYYIDNEASFSAANYISFINREAPLYKITARLDDNITDLDHYREEISRFYEYSFKRDDIFLKNIRFAVSSLRGPTCPPKPKAKALWRRRKGRSNLRNAAILITGGFHTENLAELFKKNNISYVSIMPNFKNPDNYESPYFKILSGEKYRDIREALPSVLNKALAIPDQLNIEMREAIKRDGWLASRSQISVPVGPSAPAAKSMSQRLPAQRPPSSQKDTEEPTEEPPGGGGSGPPPPGGGGGGKNQQVAASQGKGPDEDTIGSDDRREREITEKIEKWLQEQIEKLRHKKVENAAIATSAKSTPKAVDDHGWQGGITGAQAQRIADEARSFAQANYDIENVSLQGRAVKQAVEEVIGPEFGKDGIRRYLAPRIYILPDSHEAMKGINGPVRVREPAVGYRPLPLPEQEIIVIRESDWKLIEAGDTETLLKLAHEYMAGYVESHNATPGLERINGEDAHGLARMVEHIILANALNGPTPMLNYEASVTGERLADVGVRMMAQYAARFSDLRSQIMQLLEQLRTVNATLEEEMDRHLLKWALDPSKKPTLNSVPGLAELLKALTLEDENGDEIPAKIEFIPVPSELAKKIEKVRYHVKFQLWELQERAEVEMEEAVNQAIDLGSKLRNGQIKPEAVEILRAKLRAFGESLKALKALIQTAVEAEGGHLLVFDETLEDEASTTEVSQGRLRLDEGRYKELADRLREHIAQDQQRRQERIDGGLPVPEQDYAHEGPSAPTAQPQGTAPASLIGTGRNPALYLAPPIEEAARAGFYGLSLYLGGYILNIFNLVFVILHYPFNRAKYIEDHRLDNEGRSPPETEVLLNTLATPLAVTAISIITAIAISQFNLSVLPSSAIFFAINASLHHLMNRFALSRNMTPASLNGPVSAEECKTLLATVPADPAAVLKNILIDNEAWKSEVRRYLDIIRYFARKDGPLTADEIAAGHKMCEAIIASDSERAGLLNAGASTLMGAHIAYATLLKKEGEALEGEAKKITIIAAAVHYNTEIPDISRFLALSNGAARQEAKKIGLEAFDGLWDCIKENRPKEWIRLYITSLGEFRQKISREKDTYYIRATLDLISRMLSVNDYGGVSPIILKLPEEIELIKGDPFYDEAKEILYNIQRELFISTRSWQSLLILVGHYLRSNPDSLQAHIQHAEACELCGEFEGLEDEIRYLMKSDILSNVGQRRRVGLVYALTNLGLYYARNNRPDEAAKAYADAEALLETVAAHTQPGSSGRKTCDIARSQIFLYKGDRESALSILPEASLDAAAFTYYVLASIISEKSAPSDGDTRRLIEAFRGVNTLSGMGDALRCHQLNFYNREKVENLHISLVLNEESLDKETLTNMATFLINVSPDKALKAAIDILKAGVHNADDSKFERAFNVLRYFFGVYPDKAEDALLDMKKNGEYYSNPEIKSFIDEVTGIAEERRLSIAQEYRRAFKAGDWDVCLQIQGQYVDGPLLSSGSGSFNITRLADLVTDAMVEVSDNNSYGKTLKPFVVASHTFKGTSLINHSKWQEASGHFKKAIGLYGMLDWTRRKDVDPELLFHAYYGLAMCLINMGDDEGALKQRDTALAILQSNTELFDNDRIADFAVTSAEIIGKYRSHRAAREKLEEVRKKLGENFDKMTADTRMNFLMALSRHYYLAVYDREPSDEGPSFADAKRCVEEAIALLPYDIGSIPELDSLSPSEISVLSMAASACFMTNEYNKVWAIMDAILPIVSEGQKLTVVNMCTRQAVREHMSGNTQRALEMFRRGDALAQELMDTTKDRAILAEAAGRLAQSKACQAERFPNMKEGFAAEAEAFMRHSEGIAPTTSILYLQALFACKAGDTQKAGELLLEAMRTDIARCLIYHVNNVLNREDVEKVAGGIIISADGKDGSAEIAADFVTRLKSRAAADRITEMIRANFNDPQFFTEHKRSLMLALPVLKNLGGGEEAPFLREFREIVRDSELEKAISKAIESVEDERLQGDSWADVINRHIASAGSHFAEGDPAKAKSEIDEGLECLKRRAFLKPDGNGDIKNLKKQLTDMAESITRAEDLIRSATAAFNDKKFSKARDHRDKLIGMGYPLKPSDDLMSELDIYCKAEELYCSRDFDGALAHIAGSNNERKRSAFTKRIDTVRKAEGLAASGQFNGAIGLAGEVRKMFPGDKIAAGIETECRDAMQWVVKKLSETRSSLDEWLNALKNSASKKDVVRAAVSDIETAMAPMKEAISKYEAVRGGAEVKTMLTGVFLRAYTEGLRLKGAWQDKERGANYPDAKAYYYAALGIFSGLEDIMDHCYREKLDLPSREEIDTNVHLARVYLELSAQLQILSALYDVEKNKQEHRKDVSFEGITITESNMGFSLRRSNIKNMAGMRIRDIFSPGDTFVMLDSSGQKDNIQFEVVELNENDGGSVRFRIIERQRDRIATILSQLPKSGTMRLLPNIPLRLQFEAVSDTLNRLKLSISDNMTSKIGDDPLTLSRECDMILGLRPSVSLGGRELPLLYRSFSDPKAEKQRRFIYNAVDLSAPLTLCQGPPGTGKTTCIVECDRQLLLDAVKDETGKGMRVLNLSPSHPAVDAIGRRLAAAGVTFARVASRDEKIADDIMKIWEDKRNILRKFQDDYREKGTGYLVLGTLEGFMIDNDIRSLSKDDRFFLKYDVIVIDEAARATLPQVLAALKYLDAGKNVKIVLVGDHKQLRPHGVTNAKISECKRELADTKPTEPERAKARARLNDVFHPVRVHDYGVSPFEKLWRRDLYRENIDKHFLDINRRSHWAIVNMLNIFYDGQLVPGKPNKKLSRDTVVIYDTHGKKGAIERKEEQGRSRYNEYEIDMVVAWFGKMLAIRNDKGRLYSVKDITVVTPYKEMRARVESALKGFIQELIDSHELPQKALEELRTFDEEDDLLDIKTIDSFQGGENKVVIYPFVVSNGSNDIGFLANMNRLVVALSRAQQKLIMIGDFGWESSSNSFKGTLTNATSRLPVSVKDNLEMSEAVKRKSEAEAAAQIFRRIYRYVEELHRPRPKTSFVYPKVSEFSIKPVIDEPVPLTEEPAIDRAALVKEMKEKMAALVGDDKSTLRQKLRVDTEPDEVSKGPDAIHAILSDIRALEQPMRNELEMALRTAVMVDGLGTIDKTEHVNIVVQIAGAGESNGARRPIQEIRGRLEQYPYKLYAQSIIGEGINSWEELKEFIDRIIKSVRDPANKEPRALVLLPEDLHKYFDMAKDYFRANGINIDAPDASIKIQKIEQGANPDLVTQFGLGFEILEYVRSMEKDEKTQPSQELLNLIAAMVDADNNIDPRAIINELFKTVLRIRRIDWQTVDDQRRAWEAVATAL
ncbi:MAG: AAA domain-containing protein [Candidatus Omnitrophica bacterium]|nr:AAA domain-containing protein [Candidatus Omnitrophota bacterium]